MKSLILTSFATVPALLFVKRSVKVTSSPTAGLVLSTDFSGVGSGPFGLTVSSVVTLSASSETAVATLRISLPARALSVIFISYLIDMRVSFFVLT